MTRNYTLFNIKIPIMYKQFITLSRIFVILSFLIGGITPLKAQLNTLFQEQFDAILIDALKKSPFTHGEHFIEEAELAAQTLSPALNSLISNNISSFPLSATSAGVSFDFSSGKPVSITESLGPIFAETGRTLGKGKVNFGFNFTVQNPTKLRGLNTDDIRFTFFHQDLTPEFGDTLGVNPTESDFIDVFPGMNIEANIFAFYLTLGITNNFDISVALPLVNLTLSGDIRANVNSFTFASLDGGASHHFNEEAVDDPRARAINPNLNYEDSYSSSASGIGDLAIRLKYSFSQNQPVNAAVLLDARLPTGEEENFLGAGATNIRVSGIMSSKFGNFTPHLNAGYDFRNQDKDSDEFEFALGFDQKVAPGLTFAMDILGEIDVQDSEANVLLPGSETLLLAIYEDPGYDFRNNAPGTLLDVSTVEIDRSNIPEDIKDHVINGAIGLRYAPSDQVQLLGNVLFPLNDGGLRPDFAFTFGLAATL